MTGTGSMLSNTKTAWIAIVIVAAWQSSGSCHCRQDVGENVSEDVTYNQSAEDSRNEIHTPQDIIRKVQDYEEKGGNEE